MYFKNFLFLFNVHDIYINGCNFWVEWYNECKIKMDEWMQSQ
jgi:hypothetical protein